MVYLSSKRNKGNVVGSEESERDGESVFIGRVVHLNVEMRRRAKSDVARETDDLPSMDAFAHRNHSGMLFDVNVFDENAVVEAQHDGIPIEEKPDINPRMGGRIPDV